MTKIDASEIILSMIEEKAIDKLYDNNNKFSLNDIDVNINLPKEIKSDILRMLQKHKNCFMAKPDEVSKFKK